jgi:DNA-binding NarL/FixJ family response regulator
VNDGRVKGIRYHDDSSARGPRACDEQTAIRAPARKSDIRRIRLPLLKGLGHKEIAALLGKSERTVRQRAVAVYREAGLAGRAELSAFFLEDLLLPRRP